MSRFVRPLHFDLLNQDDCISAVEGASYIIHSASPYMIEARDPQKELVNISVTGTLNMLEAAHRHTNVKKFVLTSSIAAITDEPRKSIYSESDWNTKSSLKRNPYHYSKTQAELTLWNEMRIRGSLLPIAVINPGMTIGPSLTTDLNESNRILVDIVSGKLPGIVDLAWSLVDVRDVAEAHIQALWNRNATGRMICTNETLALRTIVDTIKNIGFQIDHLPKLNLEHAWLSNVLRLLSHLEKPGKGSYLRTHLGRWPQFDNLKIKKMLELQFRPVSMTINDTITDLYKWGHI